MRKTTHSKPYGLLRTAVQVRQQALRMVIRLTKQGGVILAAYVISDGCLLNEGFKRGNISVAEYIEILSSEHMRFL